jgi:hypothetical protein
MDWILSVTTFLVNSSLGWFKGARWVWIIHAINAGLWIAYSLAIKQYGLILLSAITILVDLLSAWKSKQ